MQELTLHETLADTGDLSRTRLLNDRGDLSVACDGESGAEPTRLPLPEGALEAVMKRYGKPLAEDLDHGSVAERMDLSHGRQLVRFRFMPRYDVIARDYLAFSSPGDETLCELATSVSAALVHLARRHAAFV